MSVIPGCNTNSPVEKPAKGLTLTLDLDKGFRVTFGESEAFTGFKTFWDIKLYKGNKLLFNDTITEFEVNAQYPSVRRITTGYELLMLVNDRPSNQKLLKLIVDNDNHLSQELIPAFEMKPRDIDSDGRKELVGTMSHYEMAGENYEYMPYLPLLVYEYTDSGIALDSAETKNVNTRIYDKFYGFEYSEEYSFEGNEKFENEMNRYKK